MIKPDNSVDVVGVYTEDLRAMFQDAHHMAAKIIEDSQMMEQPMEDGSVITDHRIINPVEVQLTVVLAPANYRNAYQQIQAEFIKGTSFSVKTRVTVHERMILKAIPREETSETPDMVAMVLQFREVTYQKAQFQALPPSAVKKKKDASTAKRGEQSGKTSGGRGGSTLYKTIYK